MFGYKCQECHKGTVRATTVQNYETKFENVPFVVPEAVIGVCDDCGAHHFSGREYARWRALFDQSQAEQGRIMSPAEIRQLRDDLGMTKSDFAALVGTTRQSLYHWEKDDRDAPQSRMVDNMLAILRTSCDTGPVDVVRFLCRRAITSPAEISSAASHIRTADRDPSLID